MIPIAKLRNYATNPQYSARLALALFLIEIIVCVGIIWKVPYTEIDWIAYMQQAEQLLSGTTDYSQVEGQTGPLVYPGGHVKVFVYLFQITNRGQNVLLAQVIFAALYLVTQALVFVVYIQANAPPYVLPLLIMSKRIHSIYLLRLFNDCWMTFAAVFAVFFLQNQLWILGAIWMSFAISIKMSALLYIPGALFIFYQGTGNNFIMTVILILCLFGIQYVMALPFLGSYDDAMNYLSAAFNIHRQFLYKWTVNWRFISEATFSSRFFSASLLYAQIISLLTFGSYLWVRPSMYDGGLPDLLSEILVKTHPRLARRIISRVTPQFVLVTLASSMLLGTLFARSLHYQFYVWVFWCIPYLLSRAYIIPIPVKFLLWAAIEYAWNVYPSTSISSAAWATSVTIIIAATFYCELHFPSADTFDKGQYIDYYAVDAEIKRQHDIEEALKAKNKESEEVSNDENSGTEVTGSETTIKASNVLKKKKAAKKNKK
ncbi:ALG3-domain-containing protein [Nadsonia fulvescens var. elongata DSM 6958]|uniref:Dol-P-Man:Man(5)GlcNAc(2)-PP-Dol alpha-1,3-mannosyltransferase n=1 Tax=Nadsonia fulvescens var. elongata DSM 6958 TaxID=857566 RepID=A0A1E3PPT8_9ASCO|nr:ALG3-domain-containing protein [Nadsonia fulvescens var. elongata DSM 6958]